VTFGRNRKEVAIGAYDYHKITPPITYTTVKPDGISFVPLESESKMTPSQILKKHPKGKEYAHLLKGLPRYPIFIDAAGEVLSLPPIINSDHTGKVTSATRDLFIECSGFDMRFQIPALNVIVAALADRGGCVETVKVDYHDGAVLTPDLKPRKTRIDIDYANNISGLNLSPARMSELLRQARYDTKVKGKHIEATYPAYRQDIMHQRDVIEDIIISYGYNKMKPVVPEIATTGSLRRIEKVSDTVSEVMVGMGMQEVLSYILTNKNSLFARMNLPEQEVVEISNVVSSNWCVFRNWLLPSLMEFLSKNKHREYPQRVYEIGDVVVMDKKRETRTRDVRNLAAAISENRVGYEQVASLVDSLLSSLGMDYEFKVFKHPSFIEGRTAEIMIKNKPVGIIGEVHPSVLNRWGLEKPVAAFELDLEKIDS
jgi:phenylalanyl-tRNA synthetase beta chain